jgi:hypothetical protein
VGHSMMMPVAHRRLKAPVGPFAAKGTLNDQIAPGTRKRVAERAFAPQLSSGSTKPSSDSRSLWGPFGG